MLLFCNEDKEQMTDNYCPPSILYCPLLSSIIFFLLEKKTLRKLKYLIFIYLCRVSNGYFFNASVRITLMSSPIIGDMNGHVLLSVFTMSR